MIGEAFGAVTFDMFMFVELLETPAVLPFVAPIVTGLMAAVLANVFVRLTGACSLPLLTQLLFDAVVLETAPNVPTWLDP